MSSGSSTSNRYQGRRGLAQLGNTCYLNAALQCLFQSRAFQKFLRKCYRPPSSTSDLLRRNLVSELQSLLADYWNAESRERWLEPSDFLARLGEYNAMFRGYHQHDSQEFLRSLLEAVDTETRRKRPKAKSEWFAREVQGLSSEETKTISHLRYEDMYKRDVLLSPSRKDLPKGGVPSSSPDETPWV